MGKGYNPGYKPGTHGHDMKPTPGKASNHGDGSPKPTGFGIGQHRSSPGPAVNNGQKTRHEAGVMVGQKSGGEMNKFIGGSRRDADISTTRRAVETPNEGEEKKGADDRY